MSASGVAVLVAVGEDVVVVEGTSVGVGVAAGDGVADGAVVAVGETARVGVAVGETDGVDVAVVVFVPVLVGEPVAVVVGVPLGAGVAVAVPLALPVAVATPVGKVEGRGVAVACGEGVRVGKAGRVGVGINVRVGEAVKGVLLGAGLLVPVAVREGTTTGAVALGEGANCARRVGAIKRAAIPSTYSIDTAMKTATITMKSTLWPPLSSSYQARIESIALSSADRYARTDFTPRTPGSWARRSRTSSGTAASSPSTMSASPRGRCRATCIELMLMPASPKMVPTRPMMPGKSRL